MRDALRNLRDSIEVPPVDPARERALLEAFDARGRSRTGASRGSRLAWLAAAAAVTVSTATLAWIAATAEPAGPAIARPVLVPPAGMASPAERAGFVLWPGSHALPPFESGEVRRVEIPATALVELGLPSPPAPAAIVNAEVIIDRAGFARAVRLAPSPPSVQ
jgi:hypothetical protein